MDKDFQVFDFHRIFIGDAPPVFFLEIVFRTIIMYGYTILLLRVLGKRGIGQLSVLELAILISFGSAVGDPMIGRDMPILHGVVAITVVAIFQIGLEKLINTNKKVEVLMEGEPNLVVDNGVIQWKNLLENNLSREDLFRALRSKDVEHLGQVKKAFFETNGQISVLFQSAQNVKKGLSVLPDNENTHTLFINKSMKIPATSVYFCRECGDTRTLKQKTKAPACDTCGQVAWQKTNL